MSKNKTFSSEITQRYALAFFELSKENNKTDEFVQNLEKFISLYNSSEPLKNFVKDPTNTVEKQKLIFEQIFTKLSFDKIVKNFFFLLIIKKRIFFLDMIIEEFLKLVLIKRGEITGSLISSKRIDKNILSEIEKEISANIKRPIKLKSKIDESLIGGVIIQIGSLMIDTSLKSKLNKYKKLMLEA